MGKKNQILTLGGKKIYKKQNYDVQQGEKERFTHMTKSPFVCMFGGLVCTKLWAGMTVFFFFLTKWGQQNTAETIMCKFKHMFSLRFQQEVYICLFFVCVTTQKWCRGHTCFASVPSWGVKELHWNEGRSSFAFKKSVFYSKLRVYYLLFDYCILSFKSTCSILFKMRLFLKVL